MRRSTITQQGPVAKLRFGASRSHGLSFLAVLAAGACATEQPAPSRASAPVALNRDPFSPGGCGKPLGAVGERRIQVGGRTGVFIVSVPKDYDSARPYPLGFAFHGRNRNHRDCQKTDCAGVQDELGASAVLVYPQSLREPLDSAQSGWEWDTELPDNLLFFEAVRARVESEFCIDGRRVFAVGTSSGGTFVNELGCRYGDRLLAVAPVSGGWRGSSECRGTPAALVIHGIDDPHVPLSRGEAARASYQQRAGCSSLSSPALAETHSVVREARDAQPSVELARCSDYQGCRAGKPLRWCEHSYGGYDGSTHGWPPVGGRLIAGFLSFL